MPSDKSLCSRWQAALAKDARLGQGEVMKWIVAACLFFSSLPGFAQMQFRVLVLSIPNQYHHDYVPVAKESFAQLAALHQFELVWASETRVFDGDLSGFAAIVFLNTPGEELNEAQRAHFQAYLQAGGGCVVVHKAIATKRLWPWYEKMLGRSFKTHPFIQTAVVHVEEPTFPAAFGLPTSWLWSDEWYEYDEATAPALHTVLTVDETTYDPTRIWPGQKATGMGAFHPVAWYHLFEGGRVFVTALGHIPAMYSNPTYLNHLYGGIFWAATGLPGPGQAKLK